MTKFLTKLYLLPTPLGLLISHSGQRFRRMPWNYLTLCWETTNSQFKSKFDLQRQDKSWVCGVVSLFNCKNTKLFQDLNH